MLMLGRLAVVRGTSGGLENMFVDCGLYMYAVGGLFVILLAIGERWMLWP
jgi:hypothetical protein